MVERKIILISLFILLYVILLQYQEFLGFKALIHLPKTFYYDLIWKPVVSRVHKCT